MAKPLSVLIIEDNKSDAELIERELTKAGYTLEHERVENPAQMRLALEKQPFDIVISDFNMPEFDGFAALKLLQEKDQDIPFIVVSGSMGEETAVAMMRAGSSDYLMKSNLKRLVPAVERELIQAKVRLERKRADEALQESKKRHRTILQTAMDGFWLADSQGRLLEVNEAYCKMSGYSLQELLAMRIPDLEAAEAAGETAAHIQKIIDKGEDRFETRHRRKDGTNFDISVSVQYRAEEGGQFMAFLQDITKRKQAEEQIRYQASILANVNDAIIATDINHKITAWNHAAELLFGWKIEEALGKTTTDLLKTEYPNTNRENVLATRDRTGRWRGEISRVRKDGDRILLEESSIALKDEKGKITGYVGASRDITERKQAELALSKAQALTENIINSTSDLIWSVDPERFGLLTFNDGLRNYFDHWRGVKIAAGMRPEDLYPTDEFIQRWHKLYRRALKGGSFSEEYKGIAGPITMLMSFNILERDGKVFGISVFGKDITERNQKQKEIENLARFPSENPNPTLRIAKDGTLIFCNPSGRKLLLEWHLVEGQLVPPFLKNTISQSIKEGKTQVLDLEHGKRVYEFFIAPIIAAGYANAYGRDITEQKQVQIELQNSLSKLRSTVEGTIETIALIVEARDPYTSGHQLRVADISVKIAEDLGLTEEQIRGIYMAGLIHDLGKIQVPAEILSKPGQLTKLEFDMIKTHPKVGYDLLKNIDFPWPLAQIIYQHHEREDGSGYPRKLKGDKILLEAKIIGIADVIEAMSSHRPYRPALGMVAGLKEINKNKGSLYDKDLVNTYLKVFKKGYRFDK